MKLLQKNSSILLGLVTAGMLAGCGSGSSEPDATVSVKSDSSTVAWNAPAAIDVLSNDVASRGALTLTEVSGALHGTASVANGKVSYTPNPGYYGAETLTYTAKAVEGGATAKGELQVAVEAVLTLNGNASEKPLPNAAITAAVGTKSFTATTNASGNFSVVVRSTAPLDFVTVTAVGAGAQEKVKLVSLIGDIDALVKSADAQGQVSMAAAPNLAVSHYSTAFTALAIKARSGVAPGTAQQLRDVALQIPMADIMHYATAVRLVADKGIPLPAGTSDTFALVQNLPALNAVYAAAKAQDPLLASSTRTAVENELNAGSAFTLGGLAERTVMYNNDGISVTYRADGTGRVSGRLNESNIKWVAEGATVRITYEKPVEWLYEPGTFEIGGQRTEYTIREHTDGMIIRLVFGDSAAKWAETGTVTWVDGPNAGKPALIDVTTTNVPTYLTRVIYLDRRLPIEAAMTAPGAKLFGALNMPTPVLTPVEESGAVRVESVRTSTDILEFTGASSARFTLSEQTVTWKVQDNWLHVTHANGNAWRFALVYKNDATGSQVWLAHYDALKITKIFTGFTPAEPKLAFTPELVLRRWNNANVQSFIGTPMADGTVLSGTYSKFTHNSVWEITPSGDLVMKFTVKSTGALVRSARYSPIKFVGEQLWMVAHDYRPTVSSTFIGYIEVVPVPVL